MKTIFRFLSLAVLMSAAGVVGAFAQDACADIDGQTALYTKFTDNYNKKTIPERTAAADAGKQFLEKYGSCATLKDQVDFVKGWVPKIDEWIAAEKERQTTGVFFTRFDAGVKGQNYDEAYAAGKEILAKQPDNLNVLVPLGVIGLYQSYNKNYKYNDDSLRYAQQAIQLLKSGKAGTKKNNKGADVYGVFQYEYTKEDALSDLTYALGYINFFAKNDKKAALPYYYEVSQMPGRNKSEPRVFATIGSYYLDEAGKLGTEIASLIETQKAAKTDDEKLQIDTQIKAKIGLFNGYAERALDAFGRAYTLAKSDTPANKTYKDSIYKTLQDIYKRRFDKTDGLDAYVAAAVAKPLPDPTSEVAPVTDPEPAKTTGSAAVQNVNPAGAVAQTPAGSAAVPKPAPAAGTAAPKAAPAKKKVNR